MMLPQQVSAAKSDARADHAESDTESNDTKSDAKWPMTHQWKPVKACIHFNVAQKPWTASCICAVVELPW